MTKDEAKHKLKKLKEEEKVHSAARICFVDGKEFLKGMKHEHMCFSIIHKDSYKEGVEEVPIEDKDMLGEFFDIVSDNVPDGLPPVSKISHNMDLVLGARLPNKATHRTTPIESEELYRQVHELL